MQNSPLVHLYSHVQGTALFADVQDGAMMAI